MVARVEVKAWFVVSGGQHPSRPRSCRTLGVNIKPYAMTWVANLITESERDLVFLWHITSGRFSSIPLAVAPSEIDIDNAISELVAIGARIGFGDPNSSEFVVPQELLVNGKPSASRIAELRRNAPENYHFLIFAIRQPAAQPNAAADRLRQPLS